MLDYLDKGYFVMFFFGFLIDKINLFPFFLGISLGLFISTNNSTIKYLSLFNESYNYIKTNIDVFIPTNDTIIPTNDTIIPSNDTIIPTNDTIIPTNDTIISTNDTIIPSNDTNTTLSYSIQETTSNNQKNSNKMDDNENIKSPL